MKDQRCVVMFAGKVVKSFTSTDAAKSWVKTSGNPYLKYTIKPYKQ